jgi:PAS domain S-box-containing protein
MSFRYLRPDGQEVWLESTGSAAFDEAGRILRVRGLRADITERKRINGSCSRLARRRGG